MLRSYSVVFSPVLYVSKLGSQVLRIRIQLSRQSLSGKQYKSFQAMVLEDIDGTFVSSSAIKPDCLEKDLAQQESHEEHQYLNLIRRIISEGEHRPDRYFAHPRRGYN